MTILPPHLSGDNAADILRTNTFEVEFDGLGLEECCDIAGPNHQHGGYGGVLLGRVDPGRPQMPPHKTPWLTGFHGYAGRYGTPDLVQGWVEYAVSEMVFGRKSGLINFGLRLPAGVIGLDVDAHDGKRGALTMVEHTARLGPLPPTCVVTARGYSGGYESSGIRLYAVPELWQGCGMLTAPDGAPGHVDLIQPHLRFVVAPGGLHHTGNRYKLYDEHTGLGVC